MDGYWNKDIKRIPPSRGEKELYHRKGFDGIMRYTMRLPFPSSRQVYPCHLEISTTCPHCGQVKQRRVSTTALHTKENQLGVLLECASCQMFSLETYAIQLQDQQVLTEHHSIPEPLPDYLANHQDVHPAFTSLYQQGQQLEQHQQWESAYLVYKKALELLWESPRLMEWREQEEKKRNAGWKELLSPEDEPWQETIQQETHLQKSIQMDKKKIKALVALHTGFQLLHRLEEKE